MAGAFRSTALFNVYMTFGREGHFSESMINSYSSIFILPIFRASIQEQFRDSAELNIKSLLDNPKPAHIRALLESIIYNPRLASTVISPLYEEVKCVHRSCMQRTVA